MKNESKTFATPRDKPVRSLNTADSVKNRPMKKKLQQTETLALPAGKTKLLLHSCCAPCSADILRRLVEVGIRPLIYFYNPNIHPLAEYELRKDENKRYADKLQLEFIDADYDKKRWFDLTKGYENSPERGQRCSICFEMRFLQTAGYAFYHGFDVISSTLGISRWKDFEQINRAGCYAVKDYPNIDYWTFNWRKKGGSQRMIELAKEEQFYQQEYCGCVYSLKATNQWRKQRGREKIIPLVKYYT